MDTIVDSVQDIMNTLLIIKITYEAKIRKRVLYTEYIKYIENKIKSRLSQ